MQMQTPYVQHAHNTYIPRKKYNSLYFSPGVAFLETQDKLRPYADAIERARLRKRAVPRKNRGRTKGVRYAEKFYCPSTRVSSRKTLGSSVARILIFHFSDASSNREFLQLQFSQRILAWSLSRRVSLVRGVAPEKLRSSDEKRGSVIERKYDRASSEGRARYRKFGRSGVLREWTKGGFPEWCDSVSRRSIFTDSVLSMQYGGIRIIFSPRVPRATIKRRSPSS